MVLAVLEEEVLEAEALQEDGKMKKRCKITGEVYLNCPRCSVRMKKLVKRDVVIDVCRKCGGMWVDAGELEKLAEINKLGKQKVYK